MFFLHALEFRWHWPVGLTAIAGKSHLARRNAEQRTAASRGVLMACSTAPPLAATQPRICDASSPAYLMLRQMRL